MFGAGKTRSLAIVLTALQCILPEFKALVITKENVAAQALGTQLSDLQSPVQDRLGRLVGRIEEGKGKGYETAIDVPCSDRNRILGSKSIVISTGGSANAELGMKYSYFKTWLDQVWVVFMDESQQYGGYQETAVLAAIGQPASMVYVGDHRQTPGGLAKGRAAAETRRKLLQRPLGLRALNQSGDYLPPVCLVDIIARLTLFLPRFGVLVPTLFPICSHSCPALGFLFPLWFRFVPILAPLRGSCSFFVPTLCPFLPYFGVLVSTLFPSLFPFLPHFGVLAPPLFPLCFHSCPTLPLCSHFVPIPAFFAPQVAH